LRYDQLCSHVPVHAHYPYREFPGKILRNPRGLRLTLFPPFFDLCGDFLNLDAIKPLQATSRLIKPYQAFGPWFVVQAFSLSNGSTIRVDWHDSRTSFCFLLPVS